MDFLTTVELMTIYDEEQNRFGTCSKCGNDLTLGEEVYLNDFFKKTNNSIYFCSRSCYEIATKNYKYLNNYHFENKVITDNDISFRFKKYKKQLWDDCIMLYTHTLLMVKNDNLSFFAYINTLLRKDKPTQKEKEFLKDCRQYNYL